MDSFKFDKFCLNRRCLMETFGNKIRKERERNALLLRQVAAELEIDQAVISKIERSERKPTRQQVLKFAKFYKLNCDELLISWLSDKITYELENENLAWQALKVAEEKIKYIEKSKL
jgi:ribosome-binding protein aMBF1 (putative translation factor)